MADKDFTAQENATREQLAEQFPCNTDPFGVWFEIDAEFDTWAVNDENGDAFASTIHYENALILTEALRIRHEKISNQELSIDVNQQKAINDALLIGLDSYGEIERISDEMQKVDITESKERIPDSVRPVHPTGANDTIGVFAEALRYMQPA